MCMKSEIVLITTKQDLRTIQNIPLQEKLDVCCSCVIFASLCLLSSGLVVTIKSVFTFL